MQLALFSTFISLALAAGPIPFSVDDPQGDPNRLIPPIPPCVECTATCAAVFAAPGTAPQPSPERTNVINNYVEITSKSPEELGIAPSEGEVSTA
ncbi:MAG: hypothetical protein LQ337_004592 [Flavoplaca oasis]|nr:MAG: hypothetical protein LQ337_004592 [Flavoplaca oasis]